MKGDINKISIKNIQSNFQLRLKSPVLTNNSIFKNTAKDKSTLTDRSTGKNIIKTNKPISKDNSNKVIPTYIPTITSITNGFIPSKVINKSSIQEIHNNVYNFYGNPSNALSNTNKKEKNEMSLEKNLNEKNEYIKYLMSENSTLKYKLQEKAKENKSLHTEIQLFDKSNYLKQMQNKTTQQSPVKSKI